MWFPHFSLAILGRIKEQCLFTGASTTTRRDLAVGALHKHKFLFALNFFKPRKSAQATKRADRKGGTKLSADCSDETQDSLSACPLQRPFRSPSFSEISEGSFSDGWMEYRIIHHCQKIAHLFANVCQLFRKFCQNVGDFFSEFCQTAI